MSTRENTLQTTKDTEKAKNDRHLHTRNSSAKMTNKTNSNISYPKKSVIPPPGFRCNGNKERNTCDSKSISCGNNSIYLFKPERYLSESWNQRSYVEALFIKIKSESSAKRYKTTDSVCDHNIWENLIYSVDTRVILSTT